MVFLNCYDDAKLVIFGRKTKYLVVILDKRVMENQKDMPSGCRACLLGVEWLLAVEMSELLNSCNS